MKNLLPMLAAIAREKAAALRIGAEDVPEGSDQHAIGIGGIDQDRPDVPRFSEPHLGPRLASVRGPVDALARHDVVARIHLPRAGVQDRGVRGRERQGAHGGGGLVLHLGVPRPPRVRGLPDAPARATEVERVGRIGDAQRNSGPPRAIRPYEPPAQRLGGGGRERGGGRPRHRQGRRQDYCQRHVDRRSYVTSLTRPLTRFPYATFGSFAEKMGSPLTSATPPTFSLAAPLERHRVPPVFVENKPTDSSTDTVASRNGRLMPWRPPLGVTLETLRCPKKTTGTSCAAPNAWAEAAPGTRSPTRWSTESAGPSSSTSAPGRAASTYSQKRCVASSFREPLAPSTLNSPHPTRPNGPRSRRGGGRTRRRGGGGGPPPPAGAGKGRGEKGKHVARPPGGETP